MKKIITLLAFTAVLGITGANANSGHGDGNGGNGSVTLNVKLNPIQTLTVNSNQKVVDLEYKTKDDYLKGVTSTQENHLTVFSTGGFNINVKSSSAQLTGSQDNIDASTIQITAANGTSTTLPSSGFETKALGGSGETIVTSDVGGAELNFNVTYKGKGDNEYINKYYNSESPTTVYTTTVMYEIVAK